MAEHPTKNTVVVANNHLSTGNKELDHILAGGYADNRIHLLEGRPGSGKTTLAFQFLLAGHLRGQKCLYITLAETRDELLHSANTHGWTLDGIEIFELIPPELSLDPEREQSIVYSSDLELGETVSMVMDEVRRVSPALVVFDSLAEIRLLAQGPLRYRRQVLALKHFFSRQNCTVLFLDDLTNETDDTNLHSLAHGVIRLEQRAVEYGSERRRLRVFKMRGRAFRGGFHDMVIRTGGVVVFPRLVAAEHIEGAADEAPYTSGVVELDALIGGGLDRGTSTLVIGPSGAGKTTLTTQFLRAGLERGERALCISFDETRRNFLRRAASMGLALEDHLDAGRLVFRQVDPAELSPGELSGFIKHHVEDGVMAVVLDSLAGYLHSMPAEQFMLLQMHEMLTYLNQQNVVTFMVLAQSGMVGQMNSPVDLTYLSDNVILLRFFEAGGEIRRALSILKKRTGGHEAELREMTISAGGIQVGPKLSNFRGILTGVPTYVGGTGALSGGAGEND